jgi:tetrahydromethanopterin S-methyltransferase subunit G
MGNDMTQITQRLDRFERSLDEIRAAMIQMAKTEERVSIILEQNTVIFKEMSDVKKRLGDVEKINATQGQSLGFFERFGWVVLTAGAGVIGWLFKS